jgi:hypothetical protein
MDGYPGAAPAPVIDGDRVTIAKSAPWPACCVKCGRTDGLLPRVHKHAWVTPWAYLALPLGVWPAGIVILAMTKRVTLIHAVCAPCNARWTWARVGWNASLLGPLLVGVALVLAGAEGNSNASLITGGLVVFPGVVVAALLAHFLLVRPRTLRTLFIDNQVIKVGGVSARALEMMRAGVLA